MDDPLEFARHIALAKLTTRAYARAELESVLRRKNVPEGTIAELLDRLKDVGLVNDAQFADQWVRSRHEHRRLSRTALRKELRAKGVAEGEIDSALGQVDDESELSAARAIVEKRSRSMVGLDPQVRYRRLASALTRRGFPTGVIMEVLGKPD